MRIHCVAHRLQLGVGDFLFKREKRVTALIKIAHRAMAKIRRSNVLRRLALDEDIALKKPILDQATRWSSTHDMLDRLLTYEDFCNKYADNKDFKALKITKPCWKAFRAIVEMLKPVQVMTTRLQSQELTVTDTLYYWIEMMTSLRAI